MSILLWKAPLHINFSSPDSWEGCGDSQEAGKSGLEKHRVKNKSPRKGCWATEALSRGLYMELIRSFKEENKETRQLTET